MEKQPNTYLIKNDDNSKEIEICDLDENKICDDFGTCFNLNGDDFRRILVDDIYESENYEEEELLEDLEEAGETLSLEGYEFLDSSDDSDPNLVFIDDIDGLSELLEDKDNQVLEEFTPGLYVFKDTKKELH